MTDTKETPRHVYANLFVFRNIEDIHKAHGPGDYEGVIHEYGGSVPQVTSEMPRHVSGDKWRAVRETVLQDPDWLPPDSLYGQGVYALPARLEIFPPDNSICIANADYSPIYVRRLPDPLRHSEACAWLAENVPPQTDRRIGWAVLERAKNAHQAFRMLWTPGTGQRQTILDRVAEQADLFRAEPEIMWAGLRWTKRLVSEGKFQGVAWVSDLYEAERGALGEINPTLNVHDPAGLFQPIKKTVQENE